MAASIRKEARGDTLVIGGGIAGTAAAFRAAECGHRVTIVFADSGATIMNPGAVDDAPWDDVL